MYSLFKGQGEKNNPFPSQEQEKGKICKKGEK
jgi:hypothetical protein